MNSPAFTLHRLGAKTLFGLTLKFDRKYLCNAAMEHDINYRKEIVNLQELRYMPTNLVNFGLQTAENG